MDQETLRDIHVRLGKLETIATKTLANTENMKWQKWHIRALWGALLALLGLSRGH
mgnify:CR=1 FL=1